MRLVVFGLTITSSWGNGHATLWRGLARALARRGHRLVFFERDTPWYAAHRDLLAVPGGELVLYRDWPDVVAEARTQLADADVAMVTSYCPDGLGATELVLSCRAARRVFYDLDTPVTLARLAAGEPVEAIGPRGLGDFDLVLSYTGGPALAALRDRLGARRTAPLHGFVDPEAHRPLPSPGPSPGHPRCDLSYLGTYAEDRQDKLVALLVEPARRRPDRRFVIAGAQYPATFPWTDNIFFVHHLPPSNHPAFFSSSRLTLNVTRAAMAGMGWCPSGRLFEAAACGCPIVTDPWPGLDQFYTPGTDILVAATTDDAIAALDLSDAELRRIADAARARTLAEHTADRRVAQLEAALEA